MVFGKNQSSSTQHMYAGATRHEGTVYKKPAKATVYKKPAKVYKKPAKATFDKKPAKATVDKQPSQATVDKQPPMTTGDTVNTSSGYIVEMMAAEAARRRQGQNELREHYGTMLYICNDPMRIFKCFSHSHHRPQSIR